MLAPKIMVELNFESRVQQKLKQLLGDQYDFLAFSMNFQTCILTDNLCSPISKGSAKIVETLLNHYAFGTQASFEGKLIKYRDIPGGYAYEYAFINRAIKPIEHVFSNMPQLLIRAAKILGGKTLIIGDFAAVIPALKGVPLTYLLYTTEEFPASGNILYDSSARSYLPTEDLAILGELATLRLIEAKECLIKKL